MSVNIDSFDKPWERGIAPTQPHRPVVTDSNEAQRTPLLFPLPHELLSPPVRLLQGDYSLTGLEHVTSVELKRLQDLVACCGARRKHFISQLTRLEQIDYGHVVIAATIADILRHDFTGNTTPASILGTIATFSNRYDVQFHFVGQDEQVVTFWVLKLLCKAEAEFEKIHKE